MTWLHPHDVQVKERVVFETDHLVVVDVSDILPKHKRKRYSRRDEFGIDRCVVHHSGGNVKPPPVGILRMGRYFVRAWPAGRGWPGFAYTFYVPHQPDLWEDDLTWGDGRFIVYQCQPLNVRSYHTGPKKRNTIDPKGANTTGISILFQGSFTEKKDPSKQQQLIAPKLWKLIKQLRGLRNTDLYTHAMYGKKACPGPWLSSWVADTRQA